MQDVCRFIDNCDIITLGFGIEESKNGGVKMQFFILAGGLLIVLMAVVISVVASVVSSYIAAIDDASDE